ncbi:unnamed protein product [Soboliphyme baturini]|uniref:TTC7_N domain-containing protein n=1 Tax=Soboliphyme baturini TaxID=241478 RepID=A0A183J8J9_9BILA|nr:unnamed protein product [Soboliphyme baturini]
MSKLKGVRLQGEIDKYRMEGQWRKVFELLPSVSAKGSNLEHMSNFYTGEVMLELFMENGKAVSNPDPKYAVELQSIKKYLLAVFDSAEVKPEVALESNLLLSKLYFVSAKYEDALTALSKAKLEQLDAKFTSLRTLRLVAEAYSLKGTCLETDPPKLANRHQRSARQEKILDCFLNSTKLSTAYVKVLQLRD